MAVGLTAADHETQSTWQSIGPLDTPESGVVYTVLVSPNAPDDILVGTRPFGIQWSKDGGESWTRIDDDLPGSHAEGVNPSSLVPGPEGWPALLIGVERGGLWRGRVGGGPWESYPVDGLSHPRAMNGVSVALAGSTPERRLLYGSDGGLFVYEPSKKRFRGIRGGLPAGEVLRSGERLLTVSGLAVHSQRPAVVFLALYASGRQQPSGVWRSDDGGLTWRHASDGLSSGWRSAEFGHLPEIKADWVYDLVVHPKDGDLLFACTGAGLFRSMDGAKSWVAVFGDIPVDSGAVAVHPLNAAWVAYGSGDNVYFSDDGGDTFADITANLPQGIRGGAPVFEVELSLSDDRTRLVSMTELRYRSTILSLAFCPHAPKRLYAATAAGLFRIDLP